MKEKLNIFAFLLLILLTFIFTLILPPDSKIVEAENREISTFPPLTSETVFSGEFALKYEDYLADQVAFRSSFIKLGNYVSDFKLFKKADSVYIVTISENEATPKPTSTPTPKDDSTKPSNDLEENTDEELKEDSAPIINFGSVLVFEDRIVEIFKNNENTAKYYTDILNSYKTSFGDKVAIYSLIAPTQIEFLDKKYSSIGSSQADALNYISDKLDDDIIVVDVYSNLKNAFRKGEYVYFRSDHHWTALGAYNAYLKFASSAGFTPVDLDKYSETTIDNFLGYLYNARPTESIANNPDYITYYENESVIASPDFINKETNDYSLFLFGDQPYINFNTNTENGKTIIVIKDSYANAFVPFLAPHYENIIVIDPRTYQSTVSSIVNNYEEVDILFLNYIMATTFNDYLTRVEAIK